MTTRKQITKYKAAHKTLEHLGYTYHGGEMWAPPIGTKPNFDLIDRLRADALFDKNLIKSLQDSLAVRTEERDALLAKAVGEAPTPTTPSSKWKEQGEPDPHGNSYDCERAALCMGHLTDDELANAVFLHYDIRPSLQDIIDGKAFSPIAYVTAAKERIRWLSRALERATEDAELYREGLDAVAELIASSEGVAGLHRNGDIAPWDELRTGGRFEGWLIAFDDAMSKESK